MKNVDEYLQQLKTALKGSDRALIQDALSDAEEYLNTEIHMMREKHPDLPAEGIMKTVIKKYGTPLETAEAYLEMEQRYPQPRVPAPPMKSKNPLVKFFSILTDSKAWGAALYMVISLLTGSFYFLWAAAGTVFSLSSLILIIGLPVTGLFLLSLRGISLLEGRLVEALLGERMPRKPLFIRQDTGLKDKFKQLVSESQTWKTLLYLIFHFPFGILYFTFFVSSLAISVKAVTYPIWKMQQGRPFLDFPGRPFYPEPWQIPLLMLAGFLVFPLALHLAKLVAKWHRSYAKAMLVRK